MALPVIKHPTYTDKFPNTNTEFKYWPFDTSEQKSVLVAAEGGGEENLISNLVDMVDACTFGKHDIRNKPVAWFEKALLAIRSKAVGEVIEIGFRCLNEVDGKTCNQRNTTAVPFLEKTVFTEEPNGLIDINDEIKIKFKPVTMQDIIEGQSLKDDATFMFSKVECVLEGEQVYTDFTLEEFTEFAKNFPPKAQEQIIEFFTNYSHAE